MGFDAQLTIDHTTNEPLEELKVSIASHPIGKQKLSQSNDVKLVLNEAQGSTKILITFRNEKVNIQITNWFKNFSYDIEAKSKNIKEILINVLQNLPEIYIKNQITGSWGNLHWVSNSNLGKALSNSFKNQVNKRIKEAKSKLKNHIHHRVQNHKKKLMDDLNKIQLTKELKEKKRQLEKFKITAKNKYKSKKKKTI